jgi:Flp pilus assembly protein TadD
MSRTLGLVHGGWSAARELVRQGRRTDALVAVRRLLSRDDVPAAVAAEAHRLAAELLIDRDRFGAARRHLKAAAGLEPRCAKTFYLAGLAGERDPAGDDRRAAARFKKASGLDPDNAAYRAAYGRAAVRAGRVNAGVRALVAAAEPGPAEPPVLRVVADGLLSAGRVGAARRVLVKAKFLRPRCPAVAALWDRVRFEAARRDQRGTRGVQDAHAARDGRPLLPFVRVARADDPPAPAGGHRRDILSLPRPHLARLRATKADR